MKKIPICWQKDVENPRTFCYNGFESFEEVRISEKSSICSSALRLIL
ncbi:hypothetical protein CLOLEP_00301 [[Clostridium] leptum DSM 753]|uniref:Uncharacterized protein n=1 Tax=[Clostridium] leptum DSM 753 TaxID=428125 RepID=A7VP26_9FIRM|nr:hypothetical protein CLOLEP_00301 [[Clostridium] leptum DSM 753]